VRLCKPVVLPANILTEPFNNHIMMQRAFLLIAFILLFLPALRKRLPGK
jgi:hypothetical protein